MRVNKYLTKIPSLQGKTIVITGASSGVGLALAQVLLQKEAHVIMANRSQHKSDKAISKLKRKFPDAHLSLMLFDQADNGSIDYFVSQLRAQNIVLDGIVLNAGVYLPGSRLTQQKMALTFGTNFYGNYYLMEKLAANSILKPFTRVVFTTSPAAKKTISDAQVDQLITGEKMSQHLQYCYTKTLVNAFAFSLMNEETKLAGKHVKVNASLYHPGVTATNIARFKFVPLQFAAHAFLRLFFHSPQKASLGALLALTTQENLAGKIIVPRGIFNINGIPKLKKISTPTLTSFTYVLKKISSL